MPYRVLIVDDSAFIRRALKRIIGAEPDMEVTASAANGHLALRELEEHTVDVVVLDVEMPVMNGLDTLDAIRKRDRSLPVVMFSTLTTQGGEATMDALTRGASDYVAKPSQQSNQDDAFQFVRDQLVPKLRSLAEAYSVRKRRIQAPIGVREALDIPQKDASAPKPAVNAAAKRSTPVTNAPKKAITPDEVPRPRRRTTRETAIEVVAIGVSTGGPTALQTVLSDLPADLSVPVVITQHMPPLFTALLAQRLDSVSVLKVCEAQDGSPVEAGSVYLAPGDQHMRFERGGDGIRIVLDDGPPVHSCRPAVDVMLESIVTVYGAKTLVVILTGMGKDGLDGSRRLAGLGARVLAQDAETSVVWGMPGFVAREGVADQVLPLDEIGSEITRIARSSGRVQGQPA